MDEEGRDEEAVDEDGPGEAVVELEAGQVLGLHEGEDVVEVDGEAPADGGDAAQEEAVEGQRDVGVLGPGMEVVVVNSRKVGLDSGD